MTRRRFGLFDLTKQTIRPFPDDICSFLATKEKPRNYLEEVMAREIIHEGFEYDPFSERERKVLDLLSEKKVLTVQQARAALGYGLQSNQLQRACEGLQRHGVKVRIIRSHTPHLYCLGVTDAQAIRIAGRGLRLTDRQRGAIDDFEKSVQGRRDQPVVAERYRPTPAIEADWRKVVLKGLRRAIPKLMEYSDNRIMKAVDDADGVLGLFGLKREVGL